MQGTRLPDGSFPHNIGEYCKDDENRWLCFVPNTDSPINLTGHGEGRDWNVTENQDGTISVTPSILVYGKSKDEHRWHGYLTNGIFKAC